MHRHPSNRGPRHNLRTFGRALLLLFALFLACLAGAARAQAETRVAVNSAVTHDDGDTLLVQLNFNILDAEGRPVVDAIPSQATIHLDDGGVYPARLGSAPGDLYIALLLDTSTSMEPMADSMRAAALQAVEAAPDGANFAVLTFDDDLSMSLDFTENVGEVQNAIAAVEPSGELSCAIDTAITAVQSLQQVSRDGAQRAIIMLTDGRDQTTAGQAERCNVVTRDEFAAAVEGGPVNVPIHIVALSDESLPADQELLEVLSGDLGSLAYSAETADLTAYFDGIMAGLSAEWQAEADVYTSAGQHGAALFVTLAGGEQPAPGVTTIVAPRDFDRPVDAAQPVAVTVANLQYDPADDELQMQVNLNNPSAIGQLRVELWDRNTNEQADSYIQNFPSLPGRQQTITLPTDQLQPGGVYTARVYPLNRIGVEIVNDAGQPVFTEHAFQYTRRPPLVFDMESVRVAEEQGLLVLELNIENGQEITEFAGRFINTDSNMIVESFGPIERVGNLLFLPLPDRSGAYDVVVNGRDADGNILATTDYTFRYNEATSGAVPRAWEALNDNPLLWIANLVVLLVIAAFLALLIWLIMRARQSRALARQRAEMLAQMPQATVPAAGSGRSGAAAVRIVHTLNPRFNGQEMEIRVSPFVIGREDAALTITGDRQISREHAAINYEAGSYTITDLRSSNGTFLDDIRLQPNEPAPLQPDSLIRLGQVTQLRFMAGSANGDAAS